MRLSARNQLNATIDSVHLGEVMATVQGHRPRRAAPHSRDHPRLSRGPRAGRGDQVLVIVKSTEVMIGKPD